ncbi:unnamed protein product [Microthlaspi erraticum]|uniref:Uncharacterized protein n=1 Tax=Microthlaspi erraticum TaxID=1685480 RepID=A0A6D2KY60_9BRAS|nr:unnamed protein product [Microthlaspi erraticum]
MRCISMYVQPLRNLKKMDLSYSKNLMELPDISSATQLVELNLMGCSSLMELPSSIGNAINLLDVNLSGCSSLLELPSSIGNAVNLVEFNLSGCSSLVELPSSIGNAINLKTLNLDGCSNLVKLPSSIGNITNLSILKLGGCSRLVDLPFSIGNITFLKELTLVDCSCLVELPSSIGNAFLLRKLDLSGCFKLVKLPSSIGNAFIINKLDLSGCLSLVELPSSIGSIVNLHTLSLIGCSSLMELPSSIGNVTNITEMDFSGCSSLVEIPFAIGNLHKLERLSFKGCSKIKVLPFNINLKSLNLVDLSDCVLLKLFPEISTNIKFLMLSGTAIEEIPSSTVSWSRLYRLILKGCKKLVSLPQLSDSLSHLDAENCESLERLDCFFLNQNITLNFANCFKLNQEARDLIVQIQTRGVTILPGVEVPAYFTYRATQDFLTLKLDHKPLHTALRFKGSILLINEAGVGACLWMRLHCRIMFRQNGLTVTQSPTNLVVSPVLAEHLYTFEIIEEVTSDELFFRFEIYTFTDTGTWKIGECGVIQLLEIPLIGNA